jgi:hypothetical protein
MLGPVNVSRFLPSAAPAGPQRAVHSAGLAMVVVIGTRRRARQRSNNEAITARQRQRQRPRSPRAPLLLFNGSNSGAQALRIYRDWLSRHAGTDRITGSKTADTRAALVEYFRDQGTVMIATEAGAEGINPCGQFPSKGTGSHYACNCPEPGGVRMLPLQL